MNIIPIPSAVKRVIPDWLAITIAFCVVLMTVAVIYDLGVRQGQGSALKTAYEVCKKVAPLKDGEGCI